VRLYRDFETQEEIDAEYDLESVLDMNSYGEWMKESARSARRDLAHERQIHYGPTVDEFIDIFPSETPNSPVLVFIHGGWWRAMLSSDFHMVARGPVSLGMTVVMVNYSHCPKVSISEITRQNRAALAWTYHNISRFNGDPEAIFVSGHSAGGHQVGMLSVTDWVGAYGLPSDVIKGGIPISGLFDLRPFRYSWLQPKLLLTHETIARESPLFLVEQAPKLPPLLTTLGGDESAEFHRQSSDFSDQWRLFGGEATGLDQPGKDHISAIAGFEDPGSTLCCAIKDFTNRIQSKRASFD